MNVSRFRVALNSTNVAIVSQGLIEFTDFILSEHKATLSYGYHGRSYTYDQRNITTHQNTSVKVLLHPLNHIYHNEGKPIIGPIGNLLEYIQTSPLLEELFQLWNIPARDEDKLLCSHHMKCLSVILYLSSSNIIFCTTIVNRILHNYMKSIQQQLSSDNQSLIHSTLGLIISIARTSSQIARDVYQKINFSHEFIQNLLWNGKRISFSPPSTIIVDAPKISTDSRYLLILLVLIMMRLASDDMIAELFSRDSILRKLISTIHKDSMEGIRLLLMGIRYVQRDDYYIATSIKQHLIDEYFQNKILQLFDYEDEEYHNIAYTFLSDFIRHLVKHTNCMKKTFYSRGKNIALRLIKAIRGYKDQKQRDLQMLILRNQPSLLVSALEAIDSSWEPPTSPSSFNDYTILLNHLVYLLTHVDIDPQIRNQMKYIYLEYQNQNNSNSNSNSNNNISNNISNNSNSIPYHLSSLNDFTTTIMDGMLPSDFSKKDLTRIITYTNTHMESLNRVNSGIALITAITNRVSRILSIDVKSFDTQSIDNKPINDYVSLFQSQLFHSLKIAYTRRIPDFNYIISVRAKLVKAFTSIKNINKDVSSQYDSNDSNDSSNHDYDTTHPFHRSNMTLESNDISVNNHDFIDSVELNMTMKEDNIDNISKLEISDEYLSKTTIKSISNDGTLVLSEVIVSISKYFLAFISIIPYTSSELNFDFIRLLTEETYPVTSNTIDTNNNSTLSTLQLLSEATKRGYCRWFGTKEDAIKILSNLIVLSDWTTQPTIKRSPLYKLLDIIASSSVSFLTYHLSDTINSSIYRIARGILIDILSQSGLFNGNGYVDIEMYMEMIHHISMLELSHVTNSHVIYHFYILLILSYHWNTKLCYDSLKYITSDIKGYLDYSKYILPYSPILYCALLLSTMNFHIFESDLPKYIRTHVEQKNKSSLTTDTMNDITTASDNFMSKYEFGYQQSVIKYISSILIKILPNVRDSNAYIQMFSSPLFKSIGNLPKTLELDFIDVKLSSLQNILLSVGHLINGVIFFSNTSSFNDDNRNYDSYSDISTNTTLNLVELNGLMNLILDSTEKRIDSIIILSQVPTLDMKLSDESIISAVDRCIGKDITNSDDSDSSSRKSNIFLLISYMIAVLSNGQNRNIRLRNSSIYYRILLYIMSIAYNFNIFSNDDENDENESKNKSKTSSDSILLLHSIFQSMNALNTFRHSTQSVVPITSSMILSKSIKSKSVSKKRKGTINDERNDNILSPTDNNSNNTNLAHDIRSCVEDVLSYLSKVAIKHIHMILSQSSFDSSFNINRISLICDILYHSILSHNTKNNNNDSDINTNVDNKNKNNIFSSDNTIVNTCYQNLILLLIEKIFPTENNVNKFMHKSNTKITHRSSHGMNYSHNHNYNYNHGDNIESYVKLSSHSLWYCIIQHIITEPMDKLVCNKNLFTIGWNLIRYYKNYDSLSHRMIQSVAGSSSSSSSSSSSDDRSHNYNHTHTMSVLSSESIKNITKLFVNAMISTKSFMSDNTIDRHVDNSNQNMLSFTISNQRNTVVSLRNKICYLYAIDSNHAEIINLADMDAIQNQYEETENNQCMFTISNVNSMNMIDKSVMNDVNMTSEMDIDMDINIGTSRDENRNTELSTDRVKKDSIVKGNLLLYPIYRIDNCRSSSKVNEHRFLSASIINHRISKYYHFKALFRNKPIHLNTNLLVSKNSLPTKTDKSDKINKNDMNDITIFIDKYLDILFNTISDLSDSIPSILRSMRNVCISIAALKKKNSSISDSDITSHKTNSDSISVILSSLIMDEINKNTSYYSNQSIESLEAQHRLNSLLVYFIPNLLSMVIQSFDHNNEEEDSILLQVIEIYFNILYYLFDSAISILQTSHQEIEEDSIDKEKSNPLFDRDTKEYNLSKILHHIQSLLSYNICIDDMDMNGEYINDVMSNTIHKKKFNKYMKNILRHGISYPIVLNHIISILTNLFYPISTVQSMPIFYSICQSVFNSTEDFFHPIAVYRMILSHSKFNSIFFLFSSNSNSNPNSVISDNSKENNRHTMNSNVNSPNLWLLRILIKFIHITNPKICCRMSLSSNNSESDQTKEEDMFLIDMLQEYYYGTMSESDRLILRIFYLLSIQNRGPMLYSVQVKSSSSSSSSSSSFYAKTQSSEWLFSILNQGIVYNTIANYPIWRDIIPLPISSIEDSYVNYHRNDINSILNIPNVEYDCLFDIDAKVYDPCYWIPMLFNHLRRQEISVRRLAQSGGLSLLFASCSSKSNPLIQSYAIASMELVYEYTQLQTSDKDPMFRERPEVNLMLNFFRNAITNLDIVYEETNRMMEYNHTHSNIPNISIHMGKDFIPPSTVLFLSRAVLHIFHPSHELYPKITKYILSRPYCDLKDIPMFEIGVMIADTNIDAMVRLNSPDSRNREKSSKYTIERLLVLRMIRDHIHSKQDHQNMCRKNAYSRLMLLFPLIANTIPTISHSIESIPIDDNSSNDNSNDSSSSSSNSLGHAILDIFDKILIQKYSAKYLLEKCSFLRWIDQMTTIHPRHSQTISLLNNKSQNHIMIGNTIGYSSPIAISSHLYPHLLQLLRKVIYATYLYQFEAIFDTVFSHNIDNITKPSISLSASISTSKTKSKLMSLEAIYPVLLSIMENVINIYELGQVKSIPNDFYRLLVLCLFDWQTAYSDYRNIDHQNSKTREFIFNSSVLSIPYEMILQLIEVILTGYNPIDRSDKNDLILSMLSLLSLSQSIAKITSTSVVVSNIQSMIELIISITMKKFHIISHNNNNNNNDSNNRSNVTTNSNTTTSTTMYAIISQSNHESNSIDTTNNSIDISGEEFNYSKYTSWIYFSPPQLFKNKYFSWIRSKNNTVPWDSQEYDDERAWSMFSHMDWDHSPLPFISKDSKRSTTQSNYILLNNSLKVILLLLSLSDSFQSEPNEHKHKSIITNDCLLNMMRWVLVIKDSVGTAVSSSIVSDSKMVVTPSATIQSIERMANQDLYILLSNTVYFMTRTDNNEKIDVFIDNFLSIQIEYRLALILCYSFVLWTKNDDDDDSNRSMDKNSKSDNDQSFYQKLRDSIQSIYQTLIRFVINHSNKESKIIANVISSKKMDKSLGNHISEILQYPGNNESTVRESSNIISMESNEILKLSSILFDILSAVITVFDKWKVDDNASISLRQILSNVSNSKTIQDLLHHKLESYVSTIKSMSLLSSTSGTDLKSTLSRVSQNDINEVDNMNSLSKDWKPSPLTTKTPVQLEGVDMIIESDRNDDKDDSKLLPMNMIRKKILSSMKKAQNGTITTKITLRSPFQSSSVNTMTTSMDENHVTVVDLSPSLSIESNHSSITDNQDDMGDILLLKKQKRMSFDLTMKKLKK